MTAQAGAPTGGGTWNQQMRLPEVLGEYSQHRERVQQPGGDEIVRRLDFIDGVNLVAQVLLTKLHPASPPFGQMLLAVLLPVDHKNSRLPEFATNLERMMQNLKRGRPANLIRPSMKKVLLQLLEDKLLRVIDAKEDAEFARFSIPEAIAAMFFVEKKGKLNAWLETLMRAITDARDGNATLKDSAAFNLFTLEALLQCVSNVQRAAVRNGVPFFVVNVDLRHWFHQLPLPRHLGRLFTFDLPVAKGEPRHRLCPRAVPMGWKDAPKIGQAATWSMLLGRDGEGRSMEWSKAGINSRYGQAIEMPAWVPFEAVKGQEGFTGTENGGIFVILDNIFVITPIESYAEFWRARIVSQTAAFNAKIKLETREDGTEIPPAVVRLEKSSARRTEFMGISFGYHGWQTAKKEQVHALGSTWGTGTHRNLSALLGEVLWSLRVGQHRLIDHLPFMKLYQLATPATHAEWDNPVVVGDPEFKILGEYVSVARMHQQVEPIPTWHPTRVHLGATDASDGAERALIAYVPYDDTGRVLASLWVGGKNDCQHINVGELKAIVLAVKTALARDADIDLFIIATDNTCAKGWVERGFSDRADAQALLIELFALLNKDGRRRRIYCPYVRSENNVADLATRDDLKDGDSKGVDIEKGKLTWAVLEDAREYCAQKAVLTGRQALREAGSRRPR